MRKRVIPKTGKSNYFDSRAIAELVDIDTGKPLAPIYDTVTANKFADKYGQPRPYATQRGGPSLGAPTVAYPVKSSSVSVPNIPGFDIPDTTYYERNPYYPTSPSANRARVSGKFHDLNTPVGTTRNLDPYKFFPKYNPLGDYREGLFTMLDIETGAVNEPISISAVKYKLTTEGKIHIVDYMNKYYMYNPKGLSKHGNIATEQGRINYEIHKLSPSDVIKLGATSTFNRSIHAKEIFSFIGNSKVSGYNIWGGDNPYLGFDLKNIFTPSQIAQLKRDGGILDLFMLYKNAADNPYLKDRSHIKHELSKDAIFKAYTGKTLEEAGLPSHMSLADVLAQMLIHERGFNEKSDFGTIMRAASKPRMTYVGADEFRVFETGGKTYTLKEVTGLEGDFMGTLNEAMDKQTFETWISAFKEYTGAVNKEISSMLSTAQELKSLTQNAQRQNIAGETSIVKSYIKAEREGDIKTMQAYESIYSGYAWDNMLKTRRAGAEAMLNAEELTERKNIEKWANKKGWGDIYKTYYQTADTEVLKDIIESVGNERDLIYGRLNNNTMFGLRRMARNNPEVMDMINRISGKESDEEYFNKIEDIKDALRNVGKESGDATLSFLKMNKALHLVGSSAQSIVNIGNSFNAINRSLPIWANMSVANMESHQLSGTFSSAQGIVPSDILNIFSRYGAAGLNSMNIREYNKDYEWNKKTYNAIKESESWKKGGAAAQGVGSVLTAIGSLLAITGVGTVPGIALAGLGVATSTGGGIASWWGDKKVSDINKERSDAEYLFNMEREQKIFAGQQQVQHNFNVLGGVLTYVSTPFKIFGNVLKSVIGIVGKFGVSMSNVMASMGNLGHPLTSLTGIDYGAYNGLSALDAAAGLRTGTLNAMHNTFATQQIGMYRMGSFNMQRVIASAMLGVFGDVYSNGGNTQAQLNRTIDKLYNRMKNPRDAQMVMGLASSIDSNLPQVLETLKKINSVPGYANLTYSQLVKPVFGGYNAIGSWTNPLQEGERNRMAVDYTQWSASMNTFTANKQRLASMVWNSFGKDLFDVFNQAFDGIVKGLKDSKLFSYIRSIVDDLKKGDYSSAWDKTLSGLKTLGNWMLAGISSITSSTKAGIKSTVAFIMDCWDSVIIYLARGLDKIWDTLSKVTINTDKLFEAFTTRDPKRRSQLIKEAIYVDKGKAFEGWNTAKSQESYYTLKESNDSNKIVVNPTTLYYMKGNGRDWSFDPFMDTPELKTNLYVDRLGNYSDKTLNLYNELAKRRAQYEIEMGASKNGNIWVGKHKKGFKGSDADFFQWMMDHKGGEELLRAIYGDDTYAKIWSKLGKHPMEDLAVQATLTGRHVADKLLDDLLSKSELSDNIKDLVNAFRGGLKLSMDVKGAEDKGNGEYVIPKLLQFKITSDTTSDLLIAKSTGGN